MTAYLASTPGITMLSGITAVLVLALTWRLCEPPQAAHRKPSARKPPRAYRALPPEDTQTIEWARSLRARPTLTALRIRSQIGLLGQLIAAGLTAPPLPEDPYADLARPWADATGTFTAIARDEWGL